MAKTSKRRKAKPTRIIDPFVRPTPERLAHNDTQSAGPAVRVIPPIQTLHAAGKLTTREYDALAHYRTQANQAEDDVAQSSALDPEKAMGGGGGGFGSRIPASVMCCTPAILETARIERDLGSLRAIARFIAADDKTLSQWCIEQHGGEENMRGNKTRIEPKGGQATVERELFELRLAAARIMK